MNRSQNRTQRLLKLIVIWFALQFGFASSVVAGYKPAGREFQINTHFSDAQWSPSVAPLANGGFVVTWHSDGQDGSGPGVYGQLFDNYTKKVGAEFSVNTYTDHTQDLPSAAGLSGGGFVVTWASFDQNESDWDVYGQVFESNGTKVGSEFLVNTTTTGDQICPSTASLSGGGFVVTWESDGQDLSGKGIYGQVFDSSGTKVGNEFGVNTFTVNDQSSPSSAGLSGGGFVVTWTSLGQDPNAPDVYGQVFDSTRKKVGSEFKVNTFTLGSQILPSVAALSGGGFVVTWASFDQNESDWDVYGQVFGSNGTKMGNEFMVNKYIMNAQWLPSVAGLSGGGFVVTWESDGQDGSYYGVYAQVFDSAGNRVGSEFQLNTFINNDQGDTSVAALSGGRFVVAWHSKGQDGSEWGVYGRRYSFEGEVYRDELILDFGPAYGLWQYERTRGYDQWKTATPTQMVTVDLNGDGADELVADFPGYGLCKKDSANDWHPMNNNNPEKMIAADIDGNKKDELVAGFIGYGLYYYDDLGGCSPRINAIIPDAMVRYSDGLVCDFGTAHGLWSYNISDGWVQLNPEDPDKIVAADIDGDGGDELVVSFEGWGLYIYEPVDRTWDRINTVIPDEIVAVDIDGDGDDELAISFAGYGLYIYEPVSRTWDRINTEIPQAVIRHGKKIAVDFGAAYGLWVWSRDSDWVSRNTADPGQMVVVDINNDGVEELVVSFSGYGLYYHDETDGWHPLHDVVPEDMKPIDFYP